MSSSTVKLSKAQTDFVKKITGEKDPQDAIDVIVSIMQEEELPRKHIVDLIDRCIKNYDSYLEKLKK